MFQRTLKNGEIRVRKFFTYSPKNKSLFCIPCKLFGGKSLLGTDGYSDWRNVNKVVESHENSNEHHTCAKAIEALKNNLVQFIMGTL